MKAVENQLEGTVDTSMRVDNVYSAYKVYNTNGAGRPRRTGATGGQSQDIFSLSVQAEDYQLARRAVSRLPDVRQDLVNTLQTQIANGQYKVSADMVADRILQNSSIY